MKPNIFDHITERPPLFPHWLRFWSQPVLRLFFLKWAGYRVDTEGDWPSGPSVLALAPHGEHINSLEPDFDVDSLVLLGSLDHWPKWSPFTFFASLAVSMRLLDRKTKPMPVSVARSLVLDTRKALAAGAHVGVWTQGSRIGAPSEESTEAWRETLEPGAAFLGRAAGVDVYPIRLVYSDPSYNPSKKKKLSLRNPQTAVSRAYSRIIGKRPKPITVSLRIGQPIEVDKKMSDDAALDQLARAYVALASKGYESFLHRV